MSLARRIFNLLEGKWIINREILNVGRLAGDCTFKREDSQDTLVYQEKGTFHLLSNNESYQASRKYLYKLTDNDIYVFFDDNRFFHQFYLNNKTDTNDLTELIITAVHNCSPDVYNIRYEFNLDTPNKFYIIYDVKGPNKDYVSKTFLKKTEN